MPLPALVVRTAEAAAEVKLFGLFVLIRASFQNREHVTDD